jgi:hypothetical protein
MLDHFLSERYSEELYGITEEEHDALMAEMLAAYDEQNTQLAGNEHEAWRGSKLVGGILIKKACEHSSCPHTRCERGLRIGGFEI